MIGCPWLRFDEDFEPKYCENKIEVNGNAETK